MHTRHVYCSRIRYHQKLPNKGSVPTIANQMCNCWKSVLNEEPATYTSKLVGINARQHVDFQNEVQGHHISQSHLNHVYIGVRCISPRMDTRVYRYHTYGAEVEVVQQGKLH